MKSAVRQRGFTLIEVVVAFVVFVMAISAIYELIGGALRRTQSASLRLEAIMIAQSQLEVLRARPGPWPAALSGDEGADFHWSISIDPHPLVLDERSPWRAFDVAVSVQSTASGSVTAQLRSVEVARIRND